MNRIASVVLFDVGCKKLSSSDEGFFPRAKKCLSRIILRKMFSEDNDDMAILLFGSDETKNCLADVDEDKYSNIKELFPMGKVTFNKLELVEGLHQCKGYVSDWVTPIIVGLEYLRRGTKGKRYQTKQIVIISEFKSILDYSDNTLSTISSCFSNDNVKLSVFGPDMDVDVQPESYKLVLAFLEKVQDPLTVSLDELEQSIKYFEKKRKTKRVYNVDLEIGGKIKIPVGWYKLTSEAQRFSNWVNKHVNPTDELSSSTDPQDRESVHSFTVKAPADDVFKVAKFGSTEVNFSSADMSALKRESGLASFKVLMFTSSSQINPTLYVGEDIYAVVPRVKSKYSQGMLYSLIDAMIEKKKVGVARRILTNNGKVQIGCLIPFSDESGKHLYFLKLPTSEWAQPYPRQRTVNKPIKIKQKVCELIDMMRLDEEAFEEGKGVMVRDPSFQLRCQLFANRAVDPNCDITQHPDYINNIIDPCPSVRDNTRDIIQEIKNQYPSLDTVFRKQQTKQRRVQRYVQYQEKQQTENKASVSQLPETKPNPDIKDDSVNTYSDPDSHNPVKIEENPTDNLTSFNSDDNDEKQFISYLNEFLSQVDIDSY